MIGLLMTVASKYINGIGIILWSMDFMLFFCSVLVSLKSLIIILYEYVICAGGARVHCQESGEESSETESVYSLKCHISQEVNHLHEGLKHVSSIIQLWRPFVLSLSLSLSGCKGRTNIWLRITCFLCFLSTSMLLLFVHFD